MTIKELIELLGPYKDDKRQIILMDMLEIQGNNVWIGDNDGHSDVVIIEPYKSGHRIY